MTGNVNTSGNQPIAANANGVEPQVKPPVESPVMERFLPQDLRGQDKILVEKMRQEYMRLAKFIYDRLADDKYAKQALMALEESSYWAIKSVSHKHVL